MRQGLLRSAATLGFVLLWIPLVAGQTSAEERQKPGTLEFQESHKRILHLAPTFSIVPPDAEFKPLSAGDKFVLGATHAFDRITIVKSLASAAISQAARRATRLWSRVGRIWCTGGSRYREHRGQRILQHLSFPGAFAPGPQILRAPNGKTEAEGVVRDVADIEHAHRFRRQSFQLCEDPWNSVQRRAGECLLPSGKSHCRRNIPALRHSPCSRRRHQCSAGIRTGDTQAVQQEKAKRSARFNHVPEGLLLKSGDYTF